MQVARCSTDAENQLVEVTCFGEAVATALPENLQMRRCSTVSLVAGPTDRSSSDRPTNEETAIEVLDTIQAADWMVRGSFQAPVDANCSFYESRAY